MLRYLRPAGIAWLIALLLLHVSPLQAQDNTIRITINVADADLGDVLDIISRQTGLEFSYNPRRVDSRQKISISATNRSLKEVLDELAAKARIEYLFVEDQIILHPTRSQEDVKATLSGFVKDARSGEPLIGATVILKEPGIGTAANAFGFYSLTAGVGSYQVECHYIGYKGFSTRIDLEGDVPVDIRLTEEPPVLPELLVYDTGTPVLSSLHPGQTNVKPGLVADRPSFFGEVDIIKSLETIPGVKMHSDGSTFYYVRGGNRDQNLVLIDDAPIYNPSHLLGLFSTIIPDAVNDINFYSGDTPASMGGRLSSVLDVRTRKGNDQHLQVWGSASLISTKAGIEGPITKNKSSYLLSTRLSRLSWLTRLGDSNVTEFQFYDLTGKANFSLNKRNRVFLSFYNGQDGYFNTSNGIRWANSTGTFKWSSAISDRMFVNTTLLASGYDYLFYVNVANNTRWNSHIGNAALKTDFTYFISPGNELNFGMGLTGYNFNPGNLEGNTAQPASRVSSVRNSAELVLYTSHDATLGERWKLSVGVRMSSWTNTGNAFEFKYNGAGVVTDTLYFGKGEGYARFQNVEPRMSLRFLLGEHSSIKAGYARNVQNVHMISNSISPFTSMEVWLPSSFNIRPQTANQFTLGYYRAFPSAGVTAVAEVFDKRMNNLIDFKPHAETLLNPLLESQLLFGTGRAYGFELQLKKAEGRIRGITGYSYARARRKFDGIDGGKSFNAFSDRPHQFNITASYGISDRWEIGFDWNYSTGAPFSSPVGFYSFNGSPVPIFGLKNNDRLPDYHRLDIAATFKLNRNPELRYQHSLTFSIFNLYGRVNTLFYNYNKVVTADGTLKMPGDLLGADHVTSNFYMGRFTPSLTYNFKWR